MNREESEKVVKKFIGDILENRTSLKTENIPMSHIRKDKVINKAIFKGEAFENDSLEVACYGKEKIYMEMKEENKPAFPISFNKKVSSELIEILNENRIQSNSKFEGDNKFKGKNLDVTCHGKDGIYMEFYSENKQKCQISLDGETSIELNKFLNENLG